MGVVAGPGTVSITESGLKKPSTYLQLCGSCKNAVKDLNFQNIHHETT